MYHGEEEGADGREEDIEDLSNVDGPFQSGDGYKQRRRSDNCVIQGTENPNRRGRRAKE